MMDLGSTQKSSDSPFAAEKGRLDLGIAGFEEVYRLPCEQREERSKVKPSQRTRWLLMVPLGTIQKFSGTPFAAEEGMVSLFKYRRAGVCRTI
jgi:hypothetical protein